MWPWLDFVTLSDDDRRAARLAVVPPYWRPVVADGLDHDLEVTLVREANLAPRLFIAGTEILPPRDWADWQIRSVSG
jgi:hypothetical protein